MHFLFPVLGLPSCTTALTSRTLVLFDFTVEPLVLIKPKVNIKYGLKSLLDHRYVVLIKQ